MIGQIIGASDLEILGDLAERLRCAVNRLPHKPPFSTTDRAQIYGNGWLLLGLTEHYLSTDDERFLLPPFEEYDPVRSGDQDASLG